MHSSGNWVFILAPHWLAHHSFSVTFFLPALVFFYSGIWYIISYILSALPLRVMFLNMMMFPNQRACLSRGGCFSFLSQPHHALEQCWWRKSDDLKDKVNTVILSWQIIYETELTDNLLAINLILKKMFHIQEQEERRDHSRNLEAVGHCCSCPYDSLRQSFCLRDQGWDHSEPALCTAPAICRPLILEVLRRNSETLTVTMITQRVICMLTYAMLTYADNNIAYAVKPGRPERIIWVPCRASSGQFSFYS
jgi:hypothetical protein